MNIFVNEDHLLLRTVFIFKVKFKTIWLWELRSRLEILMKSEIESDLRSMFSTAVFAGVLRDSSEFPLGAQSGRQTQKYSTRVSYGANPDIYLLTRNTKRYQAIDIQGAWAFESFFRRMQSQKQKLEQQIEIQREIAEAPVGDSWSRFWAESRVA